MFELAQPSLGARAAARKPWRWACSRSRGDRRHACLPSHSDRDLPSAVQRGFTFRDARDIVGLPATALGHQRLLRLVVPARRPRQPPRLRRRRSDQAQSGDRDATKSTGTWIDALRAGRHGTHPRPRAEPHGHRAVGQPVVAGRARERSELALTRASSTSNGSRSRTSWPTRCSCRSSAITTARCSRARSSRSTSATARSSCATATTGCRLRRIRIRASSRPRCRSGAGGGRRQATSCGASSPRRAICRRAADRDPEAIVVAPREKEIVKRRLAALAA